MSHLGFREDVSQSHMSRKWQSLDLKLCLQLQRHLTNGRAHSVRKLHVQPQCHVNGHKRQERPAPSFEVREMKTLRGNGAEQVGDRAWSKARININLRCCCFPFSFVNEQKKN